MISKAYRCYNKRLKRIVESENVRIDEKIQSTNNLKVEDDEDQIHNNDEDSKDNFENAITKTPTRYVQKNHSKNHIIGDKNSGVQNQRRIERENEQVHFALLSKIEPSSYIEASKEQVWVDVMEEELSQIKKNETCELVPRPKGKNVMGTK